MNEYEKFVESARKRIAKEVRKEKGWAEAQDFQTLTVKDDLTDNELAQVKLQQERYTQLLAEVEELETIGEREGWLVYINNYPDGDDCYEVVPVQNLKHHERKVEVQESRGQRATRIAHLKSVIDSTTEVYVKLETAPKELPKLRWES